jgi:diacylglycerol kinase family enzyme
MFAFNLPCYAGGLPFAPEADGTDGLLDVCTLRRGSTRHGLYYLAALAVRRHQRLADCRVFRSSRLRVEAEGEVPYQLDGDFAGYLPVEVDVVPDRLSLLVPSGGVSRFV